jgi:hypothetical protein
MNFNTQFESALQKAAQPLVSFTGNSSALVATDYYTGELRPLVLDEKTLEYKVEKTASDARIFSFALKKAVDEIIPKSRTAKSCMTCQAPDFKARKAGNSNANHAIEIRKNKDTGNAHFSGVMMCGSVWNCPVCNRAISSHRRDELREAFDVAKENGWHIHMVTLTVPHGIGDDLKVINDLQREALKKLSCGRNSVSQQLKDYGFQLHGYVRAKEVTYGRNGFHPHFHIIVFSDAETFDLECVYSYWLDACESVGLPRPSDKYGVHVTEAYDAEDYIVKWGLEWEMTTGHSKNAKKGLSPYQLLHVYNEGGYHSEELSMTKEKAADLFRNFAESMKGQRQLHWSVGLRKKLGLGAELTEQEILQKRDKETDLITTVSPETFKAVRVLKAFNAVLTFAEKYPHLLNDYLVHLYQVYESKKSLNKLKHFKSTRKNYDYFIHLGR